MAEMGFVFYEDEFSQSMHQKFKKLSEQSKEVSHIIYDLDFYQKGLAHTKEKMLIEVMDNDKKIVKAQTQCQYFEKIKQESCNLRATSEETFEDLLPTIGMEKKTSRISNP